MRVPGDPEPNEAPALYPQVDGEEGNGDQPKGESEPPVLQAEISAGSQSAVQYPVAMTRESSVKESAIGMRRTSSIIKNADGTMSEVVVVGRYAAFVSRFAPFFMLGIFIFIIGFFGALQLPDYFAMFEGGNARKSMEAKTADAFIKGVDMAGADAVTSGPTRECIEDSNSRAPEPAFSSEYFKESINIFFESKSGNIMSDANVASMLDFLDKASAITSAACLKPEGSTECAYPFSIHKALDPMNPVTDAAAIRETMKEVPNDEALKKKFVNWLGADTDYTAGTGSWAKARIPIGGPLEGYNNFEDRECEQELKYQELYKKEGSMGQPTKDGWITKITDLVGEVTGNNGDLKIFYVGGQNLLPRMFAGLIVDVAFAFAAIIFVSCFMWLQLGSAFLTFCGMFQILMSFALSLSTWKLFGNGSWTFMHALVIYIILGIGADNIFVFLDAWKQSRAQEKSISGQVATRFQWTFSRARSAMSVTTGTTCCAFLLTANTDLPIISTFGSFAALVVLWNFVLVITWFASAVVVHDRFMVSSCNGQMARKCCGCALPICGEHWGVDENGLVVHEEAPPAKSLEDTAASKIEGEEASNSHKLRWIERVFHDSLYGFLTSRTARLGVMILFGVLAIVGIILAATGVGLTDRSVTETFLKSGNVLQETLNLWTGTNEAFSATSSDRKQFGSLIFGINPDDPIDRAGTDPLAEGEVENMGIPNWTGEDLTSVNAQLRILKTCQKLKGVTGGAAPMETVAVNEETNLGESYCFLEDFQMYLSNVGKTFPVEPANLVTELTAWKNNNTCSGPRASVACYKNDEGTGVTQGTERTGLYERATGWFADGTSIKMIWIGANLSMAPNEQDLAEIEPEWEVWKKTAKEESEMTDPVQLKVMGNTSRLQWIAIMKALVRGVVSGVPASLVIALFVLGVTTANWWVAGLATISILGVMACFFITFNIANWVLGMYECMFLQLTVGMAVDYVVHLAHAYNESGATTNMGKMRESMTEMGVSVLSGAISTLGASICLFIAQFNVFFLYGSFIFFVILWSLLWSMFFFPAIMMTIGPAGNQGDIGFLRRLYERCEGAPQEGAVESDKK